MSEMIILKSFYRKKNTRIYLTVITLIFTAIISLFMARNYNVDQANQNLSKSYLRFTANKESLNDIAKIKGISNINYSIIGYLINEETQNNPDQENRILIFPDEQINIGYATACDDSFIIYELNIPNITNIYVNKQKLNLNINNYIEEKNETNYYHLHINPKDFNNLSREINEYNYIINVNKWLSRKNVIKELKEKIPSLKDFEEYEYNIKILDYSQMNILIFTVLLIALSIIYIIVLIINIKNILIDENKNTRLYQCLGFTNTIIKKYHTLEIISLLILSLLISIILVTLILIIF